MRKLHVAVGDERPDIPLMSLTHGRRRCSHLHSMQIAITVTSLLIPAHRHQAQLRMFRAHTCLIPIKCLDPNHRSQTYLQPSDLPPTYVPQETIIALS